MAFCHALVKTNTKHTDACKNAALLRSHAAIPGATFLSPTVQTGEALQLFIMNDVIAVKSRFVVYLALEFIFQV